MPAASWRNMPARSINRCETISASLGVSRRIGRKKRDRRIGRQWLQKRGWARVKADRQQKHKGADAAVLVAACRTYRFEKKLQCCRCVRLDQTGQDRIACQDARYGQGGRRTAALRAVQVLGGSPPAR